MGQLILQAGGEKGLGATGVAVVRGMVGSIIMVTLARFVAFFVSELRGASRPSKGAASDAAGEQSQAQAEVVTGGQSQPPVELVMQSNPMQLSSVAQGVRTTRHESLPAGEQRAPSGQPRKHNSDEQELKQRARTIYSEHDSRYHPRAAAQRPVAQNLAQSPAHSPAQNPAVVAAGIPRVPSKSRQF